MRVFINRLPIDAPWGGGNMFVKAMHAHSRKFNVEVVSNPTDNDIDVVLVLGFDAGNSHVDFWRAHSICAGSNGRTKLVTRVNENDARKGTSNVDRTMFNMVMMSNGAVFVSNWLVGYYANAFKTTPPGKLAVIHNGVDKETFKCRDLPNKHRGLKIVAHHWSNNRLKGFDVYEALDSWADKRNDATFVYIGRDAGTFRGRNTVVVPPLHGEELGAKLGSMTHEQSMYVSASRFDPGPNHVLEAIACGYTTWVHIDGGGCIEFAGRDHTYVDAGELTSMLDSWKDNERLWQRNSYEPFPWVESVRNYCDFIKDVVAS